MERLFDGQGMSAQESTRRLRALLEAMQDVALVIGPDGRYLDIAPTRPDLLYRPSEDLLGRSVHEIFPSEQAEFFQQAIDETLRTGQVVAIEYMLPIAGKEVWFEARLSPMYDEEGQAIAALLVARDITASWQARKALRESEEQYRTLVEQSNDAIYLLFDRRFVFINQRFTEMFGVSQEESRSPDFDFLSLVAPQSRALVDERDRMIHVGEEPPRRYEFTAQPRTGGEIEVEVSVAYIPYRGGIATQGIVRDITERKRVAEQLQRRGRYLACLADIAQLLLQASDAFPVLPTVLAYLGETAGVSRTYIFENHWGRDGRPVASLRVEWCAPGIEPQIGQRNSPDFDWFGAGFGRWVEALSQNEPIVGRVADFPPSERPFLEDQGIQSVLVLPLFVGGSWYGCIGFDACETAREWGEAEIDLLAAATHDVAQAIGRGQTLRALMESEERYRRLIELMPDAVAVHQDGVIRMMNRAGVALLGYGTPEEIAGRTVLDFVHPDDRPAVIERIRAQLQQGQVAAPMEERFLRKDGSAVPVEVSAGPFTLGGKPAAMVVFRDVSARKRLEEQLRQAQKMEAVGRLAGGVAHDFNNLLTAINGYAELLLSTLDLHDPSRREIEAILKAGQRAATLTQQLLAFSRRQVMEMRMVCLNQVLEDLARMLRRIIGEDIELGLRLSPELGYVRVDPAQMEQVIFNLVANARDAMPDGGRLTLETANVELDESYAQSHTEVTPGKYVLLSVNDTGTGMSPEVRKHLFEPFFTTKEGGTGLGLAMVYGIVRQFGGHIWAHSEVGQGTAFKLYLPRVEEQVGSVAFRPVADEWPRGSETILVVEDNDMVRDLATRVLRGQGYVVLEACGGDEALEVAGRHPDPIQLLLTDVVMPQMSGPVLMERLRQLHPSVSVLYMSGYADNVIAHHGVLEPGTPLIQKPFTPQALAQMVRAVLDVPHLYLTKDEE